MTLSTKEIETIITNTVKRTLTELGVVSGRITRQEMISRIGRRAYEKAVRDGKLHPQKGDGKNSKVYCVREDFDAFERFYNGKFSINPN